MDVDAPTELIDPVVLMAFDGWNDAGDSASGLMAHLHEAWDVEVVAEIDPESYYDFQVNRPVVTTEDGVRTLSWPSARIAVASPPELGRHVILVSGTEPNMRWRSFVTEILQACEDLGAQIVVTLGALLADTPHTRPVPVTSSAMGKGIQERLGLEQPNYEGPTGILGVVQDACQQLDLPCVSFWAAVPHYVSQPPCPKASLALLGKVEDLLGRPLPLGELPEEARAWERGVNQLAAEDPEIADYVRELEESRDAADLPEASGDAIAREFERYLRRRDDQD
ncbi:PAC2 family protein [Nocardioides yefusunii]|uniref:PAC2 family protein n=1 Tax=Nocardioides yefusunii TaxID=2500546 RepID=A0ABW1QUA8_9ACTN